MSQTPPSDRRADASGDAGNAGGAGDGGASARPSHSEDAVPKPLRVACAVLALESVGLLGIAGFLVVSTVTGRPGSVGRALLGAAMAAATAVLIVGAVRGLLRLNPAARTPVVVLQLLALPVSYSLAFQAGRVGYGGPILVAALTVLYLLFTPPARLALDREPPG